MEDTVDRVTVQTGVEQCIAAGIDDQRANVDAKFPVHAGVSDADNRGGAPR